MKNNKRLLVVFVMLFISLQMVGQAVPPPIPPPPPPGLSLGMGEYFFLMVGLVFAVIEIRKS